MCEALGGRAAAGASVIGKRAPPGGVYCEIAFACSHLMDSSGDKLVQAHEGMWGELRQIGVVFRSWVKGFPVSQKVVTGPLLEGEICLQHELGWRYVNSRGRERVED